MSKLLSGNRRSAASISKSWTFVKPLARDPLPRLLEHGTGQVNPRHRAIARVQRRVDAGADADFEDAIGRLDAHALERVHPPGMKRWPERPVVHEREIFVHPSDKVVLDRGHRQRARRGVGANVLVVVGRMRSQIKTSWPQPNHARWATRVSMRESGHPNC